MTSRYRIVTNTATQTHQTATIVSESPILAWYQARIGDSDTIVTGLPTLDTIVAHNAHNCKSVNRLDTIVTHNCNDAVWVGPYSASDIFTKFVKFYPIARFASSRCSELSAAFGDLRACYRGRVRITVALASAVIYWMK